MHGEAFANLKYQAYAEHARKSGHPELAKLFDENANVEAAEHFAREADALGLAKSDETNLLDGMAGESYENTKMYVEFANRRMRRATRRWPHCSGSAAEKATTMPLTRRPWKSYALAIEPPARRERPLAPRPSCD